MPFCPQCGIDNPANASFCDQCGAALIPVAAAPAAAPAVPAQQPAAPIAPASAAPAVPMTSGGVVCPQCGATAIPGEAFCDNCGAPLNAPARPATQSPMPTYNAGVPPQPSYPAPQPSSYVPSAPTDRRLPPSMPAAPAPPAVAPAQPPIASAPPSVGIPPRATLAPSQLIVATASAALPLPAAAQALVGRGDPVSNFYPDIDLNPYGALDNGVGRRHARLFVQGGQIMLEDMDSTNGTVLNGQKLVPRQPQPLRDGDQIIIGRLLLRFQQ